MRIALAQSKKEGVLGTFLYYRIKKMESLLDKADQHIERFDQFKGKPHSRKHYAKKITCTLSGMRSLHKEAKELVTTLASVKKAAHKNINSLEKDFRKIGILNKKMDKHIEK